MSPKLRPGLRSMMDDGEHNARRCWEDWTPDTDPAALPNCDYCKTRTATHSHQSGPDTIFICDRDECRSKVPIAIRLDRLST